MSPATGCGAVTPATGAPSAPNTLTSESFASGASEKVSTMRAGEAATDAFAAGLELSSTAWAAAAAGRAAAAAAAASATARNRRSAPRRLIRAASSAYSR